MTYFTKSISQIVMDSNVDLEADVLNRKADVFVTKGGPFIPGKIHLAITDALICVHYLTVANEGEDLAEEYLRLAIESDTELKPSDTLKRGISLCTNLCEQVVKGEYAAAHMTIGTLLSSIGHGWEFAMSMPCLDKENSDVTNAMSLKAIETITYRCIDKVAVALTNEKFKHAHV